MTILSSKYKIATLPGDGIGREVIPIAMKVIESAIEKVGGPNVQFHSFECGGEHYLKHNREWSEETEDFVKNEADAILLGAIGAIGPDGKPVRLPDGNLAGYNVVIGLRMELDLFANVRPVKLFEGVPTPLANKTSEDIDMIIVRENTEGLYAPIRGAIERGGEQELAVDVRMITRKGAERVCRYAFEISKQRHGAPIDATKRVTCVDKSNLLAGCRLFRKVFKEIAVDYPQVQQDFAYVDAWTQWCIREPEHYDVVVAPNEFGDIITDLGGAIQGGMGMAPAGNIGDKKAVFEPVHGSAPKHYGKHDTNPVASILAGAMLFKWIADAKSDRHALQVARAIENAVESVLKEGHIRTYDLCRGKWEKISPASTEKMGDAVIEALGK
ncbi:MAG: isocitrate/isopropylmalate dehydrogenase family protein [Candidatus Lokiarchaeota archaeon]|nr:isocitrate/isopropylmalate dehydrogenase family protein [Candidatus Lokiarchaeota archaeon]